MLKNTKGGVKQTKRRRIKWVQSEKDTMEPRGKRDKKRERDLLIHQDKEGKKTRGQINREKKNKKRGDTRDPTIAGGKGGGESVQGRMRGYKKDKSSKELRGETGKELEQRCWKRWDTIKGSSAPKLGGRGSDGLSWKKLAEKRRDGGSQLQGANKKRIRREAREPRKKPVLLK